MLPTTTSLRSENRFLGLLLVAGRSLSAHDNGTKNGFLLKEALSQLERREY